MVESCHRNNVCLRLSLCAVFVPFIVHHLDEIHLILPGFFPRSRPGVIK
jgi:hypothetical protein